MPAGKGTYGNEVGRPSNKRTGEDFLDREEKRKKKKKRHNPWGRGSSANPTNMSRSTGP